MQTELQPVAQLCHSVGAALAWPKGKSSAKPAASRSTPDPEVHREEQPVSQNIADLAKFIPDPDTAKAFMAMMGKDAAWKAQRAASGLPPLEPKEPAPRPARPKLNVLGQPVEDKPVTAQPKRCYRLEDDGLETDVTWLQLALGSCKALRGLHWAWAARQGYTRGLWRQAIGVMVSKQPGQVDDAKRFVMGTLKGLKEEQGPDPRTRPGYQAVEGWGLEALKFANISIEHLANVENRAQ